MGLAANDDARTLHTFLQMAALQARVCYMNVDRTLATWTRTALTLIVFGLVVDRYGILLLRPHLEHVGTRLAPNPMSSVAGMLLIAITGSAGKTTTNITGIFLISIHEFIATAAAVRHQRYMAVWNRTYGRDRSFGPWLALPFAVGVAVFGLATLAILLAFLQ